MGNDEGDATDNRINEVWENTRDIDNPLSPWTELYARLLYLYYYLYKVNETK